MSSVFDTADDHPSTTWTIPELPQIRTAGIREVEMDFETPHLRWWEEDILGGASFYLPDGRVMYFPLKHKNGPNMEMGKFRDWAHAELPGVHITNLNTRFEVHVAREAGIDFEKMGCPVSDVGHYAALLDDHRQKSSLEALVNEFLPEEQKVKNVLGTDLDAKRMMEYPPWMVAVRGEADVRQVHKLKNLFLPKLVEEDLMRVKALEDKVIYPVCEMEKNGAPIDGELLEKWIKKSEQDLFEINKRIAETLGKSYQTSLFEGGKECDFLNPDSPKEMVALFTRLKLPITYTEGGRPSFAAPVLKAISHPVIDMVRYASRMIDLRSKYIVGTQMKMSRDGKLRFALHQLRAVKDASTDAGEAGTVSGRFSSTEITSGIGDNIQQRIKVAKQRVAWGFDEADSSHDDEIYLIRRLHLPGSGLFLSADAKQIEYRIFASHSNNKRVIDAYKENPDMSFHKFMWNLIKPFKKLTYRQQKDLNFAYVYGAGLKKVALMLGFITHAQFEKLTKENAKRDHPLLREAFEVQKIYERELPEVKPLLRRASHLAMTECSDYCRKDDALHRLYQHRGYVRTILGRRGRFPGGARSHKAFNMVDQGTAADIMKQKIIELHNAREYTQFLMRYTVHDEADGDIPDLEHAKRVLEVLDAQSFPALRVPIRWDVSIGTNWAACGEDSASIDYVAA